MIQARNRLSRTLAALITIVALVTALPGVALADEGGLWTDWWNNVADRNSKAEIPFVILFTIPPMLVCTPIWAGMELYGALAGDGEDDES